jgi:hypothetical protein
MRAKFGRLLGIDSNRERPRGKHIWWTVNGSRESNTIGGKVLKERGAIAGLGSGRRVQCSHGERPIMRVTSHAWATRGSRFR